MGLTNLGIVHTIISLLAVAAGIVAFARHRLIASTNRVGQAYILLTVLTCLTGFPIFQRGGFGPPHVLGVLTLAVLALAWLAESGRLFGRAARYVAVVAYSLTFFFHMIPGFTETATRLPVGAPLATGDADPGLQTVIAVAFLAFLVGAACQVRALRRQAPTLTGAPAPH